jgi:hypothetical protein
MSSSRRENGKTLSRCGCPLDTEGRVVHFAHSTNGLPMMCALIELGTAIIELRDAVADSFSWLNKNRMHQCTYHMNNMFEPWIIRHGEQCPSCGERVVREHLCFGSDG